MNGYPDISNMNAISTLLKDMMLNAMSENKVLLNKALKAAIEECDGNIDDFARKNNIPAADFFPGGDFRVRTDLWPKLLPAIKTKQEELLREYPEKFIQQRINEISSQKGLQNLKEKDLNDIALDLEEDKKFKKLISQLAMLLPIFPELDDKKYSLTS